MRAHEVMVQPVVAVQPHDSLARAAEVMRTYHCGSVVVMRPGNRPLAMLTDRDICMAALRADQRLSTLRVDVAMSRTVHVCHVDDDLGRVEDLMALHQVRRLPVVDDEQHLVGILCLDDLAKVARRLANLQLTQQEGSAPDFAGTLARICRPIAGDTGSTAGRRS